MTLADFDVLNALGSAEGRSLRMAHLAETIGLSPSGLTRRFNALVRRGWVQREHSEDDRRGVLAVLTGAGARKLSDAVPVYERHEQVLRRDAVTLKDLEVFERVLSRIKLVE